MKEPQYPQSGSNKVSGRIVRRLHARGAVISARTKLVMKRIRYEPCEPPRTMVERRARAAAQELRRRYPRYCRMVMSRLGAFDYASEYGGPVPVYPPGTAEAPSVERVMRTVADSMERASQQRTDQEYFRDEELTDDNCPD